MGRPWPEVARLWTKAADVRAISGERSGVASVAMARNEAEADQKRAEFGRNRSIVGRTGTGLAEAGSRFCRSLPGYGRFREGLATSASLSPEIVCGARSGTIANQTNGVRARTTESWRSGDVVGIEVMFCYRWQGP